MKNTKIKVLIVDDHSIVRDGVNMILSDTDDIELTGQAQNSEEALLLLEKNSFDLVIVDITLSGRINGIELLKEISASYPELKTIVMTMHNETIYGERSIRAGAMGYLMKEFASKKLIEAIHTVLNGELYLSDTLQKKIISSFAHLKNTQITSDRLPVELLSDREFEIFQLIGNGYSTKEIARKLHISINTVETHRNKIKSKMNFKDSAEMVKNAIQWIITNSK